MEKRTAAGPRAKRGVGQTAEFVEDDEIAPGEPDGGAALASGAVLGVEIVDRVDDIVAAAASALADTRHATGGFASETASSCATPKGAFLEERNRATGSYAPGGYLPPCSGGGGHVYFADIKAVNTVEGEDPRVLAQTRFLLGRY